MTSHPINISNVEAGAGGYFCKLCGNAVVIWAPDDKWLHVNELPAVRMVPEIRLTEVQNLNKKQYDRIVFLRMEIADHIRDLSHKNTKLKKKHRHRRTKLLLQRKALSDAIKAIEDAMDAFIDSNESSMNTEQFQDKVYGMLGGIDSAILKLTNEFPGWDNNWVPEPEEPEDGDTAGEASAQEGSSDDSEGDGEEVHRRAEAGDPGSRDEEVTWPELT